MLSFKHLMYALVLGAFCAVGYGQDAPPAALKLDIPAQKMADALNEFARQSGLQVLIDWQDSEALKSPRISGMYTPREALKELLAGSGLRFEYLDDRTVAVRAENAASRSMKPIANSLSAGMSTSRLAQADAATNEPAVTGVSEQNSESPEEITELSEIVVTGTHIRGVSPSSSPLLILDRTAIERTGVATTAELMRKIPQNFARLDGETYLNNGTGGSDDNTRGATVDLRGLGAGSTLILLNGRRLAPAGANGSFVDVSMIPVSALDRVEVLTDGGSALYGADGVAGVVNFVLRRDFKGGETAVRYGDTTRGGADEFALSQLLGGAWDTGNAMAVYEYGDQGKLLTSQRSFIPDQGGDFDIVPAQRHQSLVLSGRQKLSDRTDLRADLLLSERNFRQSFVVFAPFFETDEGPARGTSGSLGIGHDFAGAWRAELIATGSRMKERRSILFSDGTTVTPLTVETASHLSSVEIESDGPLFTIGGGLVRASLGAAARREKFDDFQTPASDRDVAAAYGELFVPLIGEPNERAGVHRLELSVAARYDHYDDIGASTNPRVGLLWSPIEGLNLRGTYTTAYRVPPLAQLAPISEYQVLAIDDAAAADGTTITLYPSSSSNPSLTPEEATSFTFGVDWQPASLPELSLSATYFDIDYHDRILRPDRGVNVEDLYNRPDIFGPFIDRSPDPAEIQRILAEENVIDFVGGVTAPDIEAFATLNLQNLAVTKNTGFDLSARYAVDSAIGRFAPFLAATYLTDLEFQSIPGAPLVEQVDTAYQPVDFRARAGLSWIHRSLTSTLTLNYTDGYLNDSVTPNETVSSWTTADWQLEVAGSEAKNRWLRGLSVTFDVQNLTDEKPPRVASRPSQLNLGFDSTNASPRGRFISLQIRSRF